MIIFIIIALSIVSCTRHNDNSHQMKSNEIHENEKIVRVFEEDNNPTLNIIFMTEFRDTLTLYLNDSLVTKDFFVTNESIGASSKIITIDYLKPDNNVLKIIPSKDRSSFQLEFKPNQPFLYIWNNNDSWRYEFRTKPMELE